MYVFSKSNKNQELSLSFHRFNPLVPKVTRHNTPIYNILSTASQLGISQKALKTLPEDGNVMPKHVGDTTHN
jgi:hypothetical protein